MSEFIANSIIDLFYTRTPEKQDKLTLSQSRVYLFITFATIIAMVVTSPENVSQSTDVLFSLTLLFSVYALGEKGMAVYSKVKGK